MKSFEELCKENYGRIFKYIFSITKNKEATEDLIQEVFTIAYEKGRIFLNHEKPAGFLYKTARNITLTYIKGLKRQETLAKEYLYENATKEGEPYQKLLREQDQKIDETRYTGGLKLHESRTFVSSGEELIKEAGTDGFIRNNNKVLGGYVYNDSTFHFDGEAVLKDGTQMGYQFGNYVKGTFSDTYLNIGDANSYREWEYTTKSGVKVSLALSENKALVIADLPDSYVTINLLSGTQKGITDKMLEEFADLFDFSKI